MNHMMMIKMKATDMELLFTHFLRQRQTENTCNDNNDYRL